MNSTSSPAGSSTSQPNRQTESSYGTVLETRAQFTKFWEEDSKRSNDAVRQIGKVQG